MLDLLKSKTVWAAIGLIGLAVYQLSTGDTAKAIETLLAALAAFGLRHAVAKATTDVVIVDPSKKPDDPW